VLTLGLSDPTHGTVSGAETEMEDRQEKEVLMGHEGRLRYDPAGGWTEVEDDETHRGTLSVGPKPEDGERNASPSSQGGQAVAFGGSIQRVFPGWDCLRPP
jgi:hypothetical protein